MKGVYRFEWITEEDVVDLTSFTGENLLVTLRNCSLFLSVKEDGSERRDTFLLEEWILEDRLVVWAAAKVRPDGPDFVGVAQNYLQNTLTEIAGKESCSDY